LFFTGEGKIGFAFTPNFLFVSYLSL